MCGGRRGTKKGGSASREPGMLWRHFSSLSPLSAKQMSGALLQQVSRNSSPNICRVFVTLSDVARGGNTCLVWPRAELRPSRLPAPQIRVPLTGADGGGILIDAFCVENKWMLPISSFN